jgi:DNA-binding XRE family transcriptional regulator
MNDLTEKQQLYRCSTALENDKEKYITLDLNNHNEMKDYFNQEEIKIQSKVRLKVKQLRLENKKTQDDIAQYLGVDKSTYNKYENGKRKFNNDVVKQLADYYNLKVSDIVDE